jgi:hypothetical protein
MNWKNSKIKWICAIIGISLCVYNFRWIAIVDRLYYVCHSPICYYGNSVPLYILFSLLFIMPRWEGKAFTYWISYHFILLFWHLMWIHYLIFILNLIFLNYYGNLRFYWCSRLRKVTRYVRNWTVSCK